MEDAPEDVHPFKDGKHDEVDKGDKVPRMQAKTIIRVCQETDSYDRTSKYHMYWVGGYRRSTGIFERITIEGGEFFDKASYAEYALERNWSEVHASFGDIVLNMERAIIKDIQAGRVDSQGHIIVLS